MKNQIDDTQLNLFQIYSTEKRALTNNVQVRILGNETGRLEIAIIVNENSTIDEIEKSWTSIKALSNKLLKLQGTNTHDLYQYLRLDLASLYLIRGFSYTEVAMDANYDILCNLIRLNEYLNINKKREAAKLFNLIIQRLSGIGMKEFDSQVWIASSLHEINDGKIPWSLTEGPVTKQRIVDLVRQLSREITKGKIVIKQNRNEQNAKFKRVTELRDANHQITEKAELLLSQLTHSGGLPKLRRAHLRYLESQKG